MTAKTAFDGLVFVSPDPWDDVKRPRQLVERLAARAPVVYVEPSACLSSLLKRSSWGPSAAARWRRALTGRADRVAPGVTVVTPLAVVPEHRLRRAPGAVRTAVRASAHRRACRLGEQCARSLGLRRPAWWFAEPHLLPASGTPEDAVVVYDCVDRWSDFPGALSDPWWRDRLVGEEDALLERADLVLCSAAGLLEGVRGRAAGRTALVRNGADVEHFGRRRIGMPADIAGLPRPVLGYVGALAEWVDLEFVAGVARMRPDWSIALVGPVFAGSLSGSPKGLDALRDLPNVHLLGPRSYEDVPAYVASFDVAMIPFVRNGLTDDTNPIKLYEYLAAGVPVVSTPLPEVCGVDGVLTAAGPEEFAARAGDAMEGRGVATAARRREVAAENSWERRVDAAWGELVDVAAGPAAERPRILVIATDTPWPLDSGWRIRAFENIRALCAVGDVTLLSFSESRDRDGAIAGLAQALPGACVEPPVPHRIHIKADPAALAGTLAAGVVSGRPYKIQKFRSHEMRERVAALARTRRFDAVHAELSTWQYVRGLREASPRVRIATVLDEHNVESALLDQMCERAEFGALTPLVRLEAWRTARYEARVCRDADAVIAISSEDATRIEQLAARQGHVTVVAPVASDADATPRADVSRERVLMVGQLSWFPNQQAVRWFCDEVLPRVRARVPHVHVRVVGGGAPDELRDAMIAGGVDVAGYVEDIREEYALAAAYVAPFLTGGGVRIKMLDAMSAGVPIVTTRIGAKGLAVRPGSDLLVADAPADFADAVCRLLTDAALRARLAASARSYLGAHHTRAAAAERMCAVYEGVLSAPLLTPSGEGRAACGVRSEAAASALTAMPGSEGGRR